MTRFRAPGWRGIYRIRLISAFGFLCFSDSALAEIQTQHIADTSVRLAKLEPLWHFRLRTTPEGGGVAQIRTGPILNANLHERAWLIGGYYYTRQKEREAWTTTHRMFGGVEAVLWDRGFEIEGRSLVERFAVIAAADYFRFRNRVRVSPSGVTAPYIGFEMFHDAEGFRSMRYSLGLRRSFTEEMIVDFGYFYEDRQSRAGPDRHVFGTTLHWRNKTGHIDADP